MLENISGPADVKKLNSVQLKSLCAEIRTRLIGTVSKTGGHLASNLGCVELTVAMHRVFDSPTDSILFDVGHQSYVHKLLTGREAGFDTLRQSGGLSGFMNPDESEHDAFVSGHSSNSLSAALGIATAKLLKGDNSYTVAVIGDGALTGGMAFEALNNASRSGTRLIIIVNDNKMSISRNVGAFSRHLQSIRMRSGYIRTKRSLKSYLSRVPLIGNGLSIFISRSKDLVRRALLGLNIFESIGFTYLGPVDGHDIEDIESVLTSAKQFNRPVVVHVCTTKGKGYSFAEKNPKNYHGVPSFDVNTGDYTSGKTNFSAEMGKALCEMAAKDERICAITAAMTEGTGLNEFSKRFKNRFFDVGIAEQHAVTFAAGLAKKGLLPVFAVYSSFLQRGIDQVIHDAAIKGEHVVLCVDRAGIVGDDGVTHQGLFDLPLLLSIPNVTVFTPANYSDLRAAMRSAVYDVEGVAVVRYPRGGEAQLPTDETDGDAEFSTYYGGGECAVVSYGRTVGACVAAAQQCAVDAVKINRIKPISDLLINKLLGYKRVIFVEESMKIGSVGAIVAERLVERGFDGSFLHVGIDDCFVQQGSVDDVMRQYGFDADSICAVVRGE